MRWEKVLSGESREDPDLLVGRRGDGEPEVLDVAGGAVAGVGEAPVEQVDGLVGQVDLGLEAECT